MDITVWLAVPTDASQCRQILPLLMDDIALPHCLLMQIQRSIAVFLFALKSH